MATWKELKAGLSVLRCGSRVVCRKPRLQAADPTLKSAIRMPGFVSAFLMLGFTEFLESRRRLIRDLGLLVGLQGGRLGGVRKDEVDEDGGEEEEAAHHREGQGEASNLVESAANDRSDDLSCGRHVLI